MTEAAIEAQRTIKKIVKKEILHYNYTYPVAVRVSVHSSTDLC